MQAIAGLSRSLSRALVQGVVQRSQATEATQKPRPEAADTKLGETGCSPPLLAASLTTFPVLSPSQPTGLFSSFLLCVFLCPSFFFLHLHSFHCLILSGLNVFFLLNRLCRHQNVAYGCIKISKMWSNATMLVVLWISIIMMWIWILSRPKAVPRFLCLFCVFNFKLSNKPYRYL